MVHFGYRMAVARRGGCVAMAALRGMPYVTWTGLRTGRVMKDCVERDQAAPFRGADIESAVTAGSRRNRVAPWFFLFPRITALVS